MASWIDRGGNVVYTEAQISKHMERLERQAFSPRQEAILNRIQHGINLGVYTPTTEEQVQIAAFQAKMDELMALAAEARIDNQFVKDRITYEKAIARLERYELSEGRAAVYEDQPTGEYDEQGNPTTESVLVSPAIDPLPATIEQPVYNPETGEQTGTEIVGNPLVAVDIAERTQAQSIIDATPQEVIDYATSN
jgi:hypothetical protein